MGAGVGAGVEVGVEEGGGAGVDAGVWMAICWAFTLTRLATLQATIGCTRSDVTIFFCDIANFQEQQPGSNGVQWGPKNRKKR